MIKDLVFNDVEDRDDVMMKNRSTRIRGASTGIISILISVVKEHHVGVLR